MWQWTEHARWRLSLGMHYVHAFRRIMALASPPEYVAIVQDDALAGACCRLPMRVPMTGAVQRTGLPRDCWMCWMQQRTCRGATSRCGRRTSSRIPVRHTAMGCWRCFDDVADVAMDGIAQYMNGTSIDEQRMGGAVALVFRLA